jgi:hypothetical protein
MPGFSRRYCITWALPNAVDKTFTGFVLEESRNCERSKNASAWSGKFDKMRGWSGKVMILARGKTNEPAARLPQSHLLMEAKFIAMKSGPGLLSGLGTCSFHNMVTAQQKRRIL